MPKDRQSDTFPQLFGKYLLVERVADGGMAEILLAVEETEQAGRRFVTIKRIRPEQSDDPDFIDFFLTEGRVSLKFAHPNLPQVYEQGEVDGLHYLAMEYIRGHNLLELIRQGIRDKSPLSVGSVVTVALGIAAALEHAHELCDVDGARLDVIHRDVTPQNIMVSTAGVVKLIDFGIVRSTLQMHQTRKGIVKGKLAYMAPEQLEGRDGLDHRADLFALGIVMWEALVGRPLFRGKSELDTVERIRKLRVPDPRQLRPEVPAPVSSVILRALERDPDRRYPSATEMMADLEEVAEFCRIVPSLRRLRKEVTALCGVPQMPAIPPPTVVAPPDVVRRLLAEAEAAERQRLGTDTEVDCPDDAEAEIDAELPPGQESGLWADPLLVYFLRQTGARLPARQRESDPAAPADASSS